MNKYLIKAESIIQEFRTGSSLPVLVKSSDKREYVVKWKGTGEGVSANIIDYLAIRLAGIAGICVPQLQFILIDPMLADSVIDSEIKDLVFKSTGLNLGIEFLNTAIPYHDKLLPFIHDSIKETIFAYDVLLLNIDRVETNPNMLFADNKIFCIDFAASIECKGILENRYYTEDKLLPFLKRHPFYSDFPQTGSLLEKIETCEAHTIEQIVAELPHEWLKDVHQDIPTVSQTIFDGMLKLKKNAVLTIDKRLSLLRELPLQTADELRNISLKNRNTFVEKYTRNKQI